MKQFIGKTFLSLKVMHYTARLTENNPRSEEIADNEIVIVGDDGYMKWVYMKCPCGCGDVLPLSLMRNFEPYWKLKIDFFNRTTLYPSIWKTDGCRSHFWIKRGKIDWAKRDWL